MRLTAATLVGIGLVAYGALLVAACDSDKFYPSTGSRGFAPAPVPFDAGNSKPAEVPPSPCEAAQAGSVCTYSGPQSCERGDAANVGCNEVLTCTSAEWRRGVGRTCATTCPSTFGDAPDGACEEPATAPSVLCEYPEGLCGCVHSSRIGDASTDGDAGDDDGGDAGPYVWTCVPAKHQDGCPRARPRLGDRCVRKVTCDYGSCVFDDGILVECRGATEAFWERATAKPECQQAQP